MFKPILIAIAFCVALSPPRSAAAQSQDQVRVHATIVRVDGDEVYLDASRSALTGVHRLVVFRRVVVRHPITRKPLEDRFPIGELEVVQAGEALTLARASAPPARRFEVGDRVEALLQPASPQEAAAVKPAPHAAATVQDKAERDTGAPPASPPTATANATIEVHSAAADAETEELLRQFESTIGQPPGQRIRVYRRYLAHFPRSRYREALEQELRSLQVWRTASAEYARDQVALDRTSRLAHALELLAPQRATADQPLELAGRVRPDSGARGLALHVRSSSSELYQTIPMELDAYDHARAQIPRELVRPPGFAFFIEAVDEHGETAATFASARSPRVVSVRAPAGAPAQPSEPALRVRFSSELASFDNTSGRDYFLINEGDFLYCLRRGPLYGVRMGYGRFDGQGGTVQQLDVLRQAPRRAGFTYAYFETEFALSTLVGVAVRATLGLGRPSDPGAQSKVSPGFQSRLRLGDPNGTHLVVAGELLPDIGQRAFLQLGWELIDRVPMAAEVQVTDQPVNSDELAVRIVYEVGYRVSDRVSIALRPSYQLRTIRHAGPGLGLSATFDW